MCFTRYCKHLQICGYKAKAEYAEKNIVIAMHSENTNGGQGFNVRQWQVYGNMQDQHITKT